MGKPQRRRKRRTHLPDEDAHGSPDPSVRRPPRTLVLRRGKHTKAVKALERDLRTMMRPHTADKLKQRKGNILADFVNVAGPLGVSHLLVLSATERGQYLRIAKTPRGPTATFRVTRWTGAGDVSRSVDHYRAPPGAFRHAALLVLAGFKDADRHGKLCATLFQNMFPTVEAAKLKLAHCQRVVLVSRDASAEADAGDGAVAVQIRHYAVSQTPAGISSSVRSILKRDLPELGHLQDISQFLTDGGGRAPSNPDGNPDAGADSGADGDGVVASLDVARSKGVRQNVVRLHEIGPRLDLSLVKVEEGVCQGKVLYHAHVNRTEAERASQDASVAAKGELKRQRREEQDKNVARKKQAKGDQKKTRRRQGADPA